MSWARSGAPSRGRSGRVALWASLRQRAVPAANVPDTINGRLVVARHTGARHARRILESFAPSVAAVSLVPSFYMQKLLEPVQKVQNRGATQEMHKLEQFLRAEDVGRILGVNRSTVYRMAESGRLPALKVGHQWRFPAEQIAWLFDANEVSPQTAASRKALELAARAALPYLELGAKLLGVTMVATDIAGEPVIDIIHPCPWFRQNIDDPALLTECLADWKHLAEDPDFALSFQTGPLGFDRARTFVRIGPQLVGMVVAGGIAASDDDPRELYRLDGDGRAKVLVTLPTMAARVSLLASQITSELDGRTVL